MSQSVLINLTELTLDEDDMEDLPFTETHERKIITRCPESKDGNLRSDSLWQSMTKDTLRNLLQSKSVTG